jgi:hypothetical protein
MSPRTLITGPPRRRLRRWILAFAFLIVLLAFAHAPAHSAAADSGKGVSATVSLTADGSGATPDPTPGSSPSPGSGSTGSGGSGSGKTGTGAASGGSKTGSGSGSGAATGPGKSTAPVQIPPANPNGSTDGAGSGSVAWYDIPGQVEQAIDTWFGDLVKSALTPVLGLLGKLVLATPDLTGGRISQIWEITLGIADSCFVLFAVIGGVIVMTHESVQTRYGLKQILPRLVFGFIAANASLLLINQILTFGNVVTLAVWDTPLSGAGIGNQLLGYIMASIFTPDGVTQIFMVLFGLVLAVLALAVLFSFALRTAALLLLTILAPPMLLCHALPGLDAAAQLWWRALAAVLAIEFLQAATLMLMLQVFFDPDSNVLGVPTAAGLVDLLVCGALFVILLKIPGWVMRSVLGRAPRSTAMGLLRTAALAAIGTAAGVPGIGSTRMLAGRLASKAVARPGAGPGPTSPGRGPRPAWTRPVAPRFGSAHGRPAAGGQGVLFPIPKGARLTRAQADKRTAGRTGQLRGGWSAPAETAARPRSQQLALFGRSGQIPEPWRAPEGLSGPRQPALFPLPDGAQAPRTLAPAQPPDPREASNAATSGPGWIQSPLFAKGALGPLTRGRQHALFPIPPGARTPRSTAQRPVPRTTVPASSPAPTPRGRAVQPGLFPRSGHIPSAPVPRPVGLAPAVAAGPDTAPPSPAPRLVPVRMAAAPPPVRKRPRARTRRAKGGE